MGLIHNLMFFGLGVGDVPIAIGIEALHCQLTTNFDRSKIPKGSRIPLKIIYS
jgi:hypothetical protein